LNHGNWRTVRSKATSPDGSYRAKIKNRHGKYRARVKKIIKPSGDICAISTSPKRTN
jgi:hypothetical protein